MYSYIEYIFENVNVFIQLLLSLGRIYGIYISSKYYNYQFNYIYIWCGKNLKHDKI